MAIIPNFKKREALTGNIKATRCVDTTFKALEDRKFGSKLERAVGQWLALRQESGEITDLKFQQAVKLSRAKITWRIDFSYIENGKLYYHEAKGREIPPYPTQLKLFRVYGEAPLRISKGSPTKHKIVETVFPDEWVEHQANKKVGK